jgi:polysaccharide deacetylase 2 family uncharacterized protein YibQ
MSPTRTCLVAIALLAASFNVHAGQARVAIIIDDLGYRLDAGRRAIALPGPVAFAVLPGTPRAEALARWAHDQGKEVLLHLPLQANADDKYEEPIGIDLDMSRERLAQTFAAALRSVPHVIGVNGHRGSLLTRHPGHMQWLMEEIRARSDLFFVDSYTTAHSVALQMATEAGVSALRRDVFLDPDPSPETVRRQFERMKVLARKRGFVVAIGHPYETTLALLEQELPKLREQGIELVSISELVN